MEDPVAVADDFERPSPTAPAYDRQPPQDVAAEQSVLGGMLLSKDAIADVVEVLDGNDFYRPAHQVIYDCILDLYGRGEPADAITVAAELNRTDQLSKMGGAVYLHTLIQSTPTAANAGYYAAIDRKSTRLNSSHANISYAVFCLKKKKATERFNSSHSPKF